MAAWMIYDTLDKSMTVERQKQKKTIWQECSYVQHLFTYFYTTTKLLTSKCEVQQHCKNKWKHKLADSTKSRTLI